ncbi:MAG: tetratricopeptide repeat-containing glycosyltransferase family protein [Planctomycetota bacterium]
MSSVQQELSRGWQLHQQQKDFAQAESIYRNVLRLYPNDANAWCYLGIVLHDQRRYQEAVDAYRDAIRLQASFPVALNNLGNTLRYTGDIEEADACFQKAIDLKPDYLNAYKNRGTLHVWTGNLDLGLQYYEQALKLNPKEAELHRNLGVIYLLQGDFERGWKEYRWRWLVGDLHRPFKNVPVWQGGEIAGKTIVLTAEQGLGDTINFVRFAKVLQSQGAYPLVYAQTKLLPLLQQASQFGTVYPNTAGFEHPVHLQCSLLDVADYLQITEQNVPLSEAYLTSNELLSQTWKSHIEVGEPRLRIGIAWQGNPDHQADMFRSFPLSCFEEIAQLPGVELISLQQGFGSEQLATWKASVPIKVFQGEIDSTKGTFMDTASMMQHLDLVITSDTAIAHLGGALGVPTWIALGVVPDWRWLMHREDSPWYQSVRLFRQSQFGDWKSVFRRMSNEVQSLVEAKLNQHASEPG